MSTTRSPCNPCTRNRSSTTEVLSLADVRRRKLAKVSFAHGLLNGYSLDLVGEPPQAKAA